MGSRYIADVISCSFLNGFAGSGFVVLKGWRWAWGQIKGHYPSHAVSGQIFLTKPKAVLSMA